jgi:hypothetical protein
LNVNREQWHDTIAEDNHMSKQAEPTNVVDYAAIQTALTETLTAEQQAIIINKIAAKKLTVSLAMAVMELLAQDVPALTAYAVATLIADADTALEQKRNAELKVATEGFFNIIFGNPSQYTTMDARISNVGIVTTICKSRTNLNALLAKYASTHFRLWVNGAPADSGLAIRYYWKHIGVEFTEENITAVRELLATIN